MDTMPAEIWNIIIDYVPKVRRFTLLFVSKNMNEYVKTKVYKVTYLSCKKYINDIALTGEINLFKWARKNSCDLDSNTCAHAAQNGHFEILKWCRNNGCHLDSDICTYAAQNGHLEILKWCRENGCPE